MNAPQNPAVEPADLSAEEAAHHSMQATREAAEQARPGRSWPRFLVIALSLAGLVVCMLFVQGLQAIIAPVFLGLNLVIVAYPLQAWLNRRGVPRFLGATVTVPVSYTHLRAHETDS